MRTAGAANHIRSSLRAKHHVLDRPTKTELRIAVEDRYGLIKDISTAISNSHVNIIKFESNVVQGGRFPIDKIQCDTTEREKIEKLIEALEENQDVINVYTNFAY